eukprot:4446712-Pleurochrysis_carterae.AAC.1
MSVHWQSASYAAPFDTTTPLNVAVGPDAHFCQLACAASALCSASTAAAPAPTPASAVSSCPPPTADANGTAALLAPSAHPTRLRLPAPARRSLRRANSSSFRDDSAPHTPVVNSTRGAAGRVAFSL